MKQLRDLIVLVLMISTVVVLSWSLWEEKPKLKEIVFDPKFKTGDAFYNHRFLRNSNGSLQKIEDAIDLSTE